MSKVPALLRRKRARLRRKRRSAFLLLFRVACVAMRSAAVLNFGPRLGAAQQRRSAAVPLAGLVQLALPTSHLLRDLWRSVPSFKRSMTHERVLELSPSDNTADPLEWNADCWMPQMELLGRAGKTYWEHLLGGARSIMRPSEKPAS